MSSMWRLFEGSLVLLCFFCVLLPVLTREASFGKAFGFKRGKVIGVFWLKPLKRVCSRSYPVLIINSVIHRTWISR